MIDRKTSADFVTAFATGWPEQEPQLPVAVADHAKSRAGERCTNLDFRYRAGLARQRDLRGPELAVSPHADRLLAAGGPERDVGIEAGGIRHHLEIAAAASSLDRAADVTAGLTPGPGYGAALIDHVRCKIELVCVACAGERHVHAGARDRIGRTAADAFLRSVVEGDGAATGPIARHAGKGPGLRVSACRCRQASGK